MASAEAATLREHLELDKRVAVLETEQKADRKNISLVSGAQRKVAWLVVTFVALSVMKDVLLGGG